MKCLQSLCTLLLLCCWTTIWAQPAQTMHQMFTPTANVSKIILDISNNPDNIEVRRTQGSRIAVETTIKLSTPNDRLLQYLIENGRYNLVESSSEADDAYILSNKKNTNVILIKGEECHETIAYIVYIPESIPNVTVKDASGVSTVSLE